MMMRSKVRFSSPPALFETFSVVGIYERGLPLDELNLAQFRELAQSAGQFVDDARFPIAKFVEIDFGRGKFDAPVLGLLSFFKQFRNVQQRFRRDAPAIEANAAGIHFRIDQRNFHAQVGSQKCGGISAGTAADHCHTEIRIVQTFVYISLIL